MRLSQPLLDLETVKDLLREACLYWTEFLNEVEQAGGRLTFRKELPDSIRALQIESYPLLYENDAAPGNLLVSAFMDSDEARAFESRMAAASPAERGVVTREIEEMLEPLGALFDFDASPEAVSAAATAFEALTAEQRAGAVRFRQNFMMAALAVLHEHLAVMVHGQKLSALVARAKAGDDEAYMKAIQIDKRILTQIPYFKARFEAAHMQSDTAFATKVSRKLEAPPYLGRIVHKKLWLAFALLDSAGQLDTTTGEELLDLLEDAGVVDDEQPIHDVKNLLKLKARYRAFQTDQSKSTP